MRIVLERIIRADRERVFGIAANYSEFERLLPEYFPSVRIRSRRGDVAVVEEHLRVAGRELVMTTKHVTESPKLHDVFVLGGDAKGSRFTEHYTAVPGGTKITLDADIRLRGIMRIAGPFAKRKIAGELGAILDEFARIAEG